MRVVRPGRFRELAHSGRRRPSVLAQPLIDALQAAFMPISAGLPLRRCRKAPAPNEKTATAQPHGAALDGIVQATLEPSGRYFPWRSAVHLPSAQVALRACAHRGTVHTSVTLPCA